ncbi:hypothetical protein H0A36_24725 [Endozoicomonas sp. SM1973]|uniref:Uncharacterized protein n=1 Tax=Spartinivicinus marinus TaxID=2994442 RepID=A0A853IIJ4_9GAMM|nr:hypothetical protein [Spartinivicinus marinus]MCX4027378.1 hypothetical protein [Spartinivicinus marinus]NYZ69227.1 hypothetical protein [Spartinivicinus marinus]
MKTGISSINPFSRLNSNDSNKANKQPVQIIPAGSFSGRQVSLLTPQDNVAVDQPSISNFKKKFIAKISNSRGNVVVGSTAAQTSYEKSIQEIADELNETIKQYVAKDNTLHSGYMHYYAEDPRFSKYLVIKSNSEKEVIGFSHLPKNIKELRDLLNNLLEGHSTKGSLYKSINSKLTPDHALGRIFKADGIFSPHVSVRKPPLPEPVAKSKLNQALTEPTITKPPVTPERVKQQLKKIKQETSQQLKERAALHTAARLTTAIISKRAGVSTTELTTHRAELKSLDVNFLYSQDLTYLQSVKTTLKDDINHLSDIIQLNLNQLPIKGEYELTSLGKSAKDAIKESLSLLHSHRPSFKERLLKVFFPKKYTEQLIAKNQLLAELHELQYLRNEIITQPGWEAMDKTAWFQDTVYQVLQKGSETKLSLGPSSFSPSFSKALSKQLAEWTPESRSTFYITANDKIK